MKIPHSYRQQFFIPVLLVSTLGHAAVFATGLGLWSFSPEFDVEQAPSSMEVIISKVEPQRFSEIKDSKILTALNDSKKTAFTKGIKKQEPQENPSKAVYMPPSRGAAPRRVSPYLRNPAPVYPQYARERGWEGVIMLRVLVQKDGGPGKIEIEKSSGRKILDDDEYSQIPAHRLRG